MITTLPILSYGKCENEMLIFIVKIFLHSFGLFEAMSAIEMMDPKMDAGMMCNQIQRKVLTFDSALEVYM